MKILLTGANGYIGTRLLPVLLENGHDVVCMVRDKRRFREKSDFGDQVQIITGDLLKPETLTEILYDIDAAYSGLMAYWEGFTGTPCGPSIYLFLMAWPEKLPVILLKALVCN